VSFLIVRVGGRDVADAEIRRGVARLQVNGGVVEGVGQQTRRVNGGDVPVGVVARLDHPNVGEGLQRTAARDVGKPTFTTSCSEPTSPLTYPVPSTVRVVRWPSGAAMAIGAPPLSRSIRVTLLSPFVTVSSRPSVS
jgi:hypothetical protein